MNLRPHILALALTLPASIALAQATFKPLGVPAGYAEGWALGLSGDGSTIVGYFENAARTTYKAFSWTKASGWREVPGLRRLSIAHAISQDGSIIAGITKDAADSHVYRAFADGSVEELPAPPRGTIGGLDGISADGSSMGVTWLDDSGSVHPWVFSWSESSGWKDLTGPAPYVSGFDYSWGGYLAATWQDDKFDDPRPVLFDPDGTRHDLDTLGGGSYGVPYAVSDNGRVVGGTSNVFEPVLWLGPDHEPRRLEVIDPELWSYTNALCVSPDGRLVFGHLRPYEGDTTFYAWNARDGMTYIDALVGALSSYDFYDIIAVSEDNRVIVGTGSPEADGPPEPWIATVPAYCAADCNADSTLNINDFICFQSRWKAKDFYGDFDMNAKHDINDYVAFQAAWKKQIVAGGCD